MTIEELLQQCGMPEVHGGLYCDKRKWVAWRKTYLDGEKYYDEINYGEPMAIGDSPQEALTNLYNELQRVKEKKEKND